MILALTFIAGILLLGAMIKTIYEFYRYKKADFSELLMLISLSMLYLYCIKMMFFPGV